MPANTNTPPSSIGIIGVGQVGGAAANALILGSIADEILLVDIKAGLRDAQVRDLSDVAYSIQSKTRVRAASHYEAGQCDIVVIATGAHMFLGKRRKMSIYVAQTHSKLTGLQEKPAVSPPSRMFPSFAV